MIPISDYRRPQDCRATGATIQSIGLSDLNQMTIPFHNHSPALRFGLCWYPSVFQTLTKWRFDSIALRCDSDYAGIRSAFQALKKWRLDSMALRCASDYAGIRSAFQALTKWRFDSMALRCAPDYAGILRSIRP